MQCKEFKWSFPIIPAFLPFSLVFLSAFLPPPPLLTHFSPLPLLSLLSFLSLFSLLKMHLKPKTPESRACLTLQALIPLYHQITCRQELFFLMSSYTEPERPYFTPATLQNFLICEQEVKVLNYGMKLERIGKGD